VDLGPGAAGGRALEDDLPFTRIMLRSVMAFTAAKFCPRSPGDP
jgi:hypothetical protein